MPRLQLFTGNESLSRELVMTGRNFGADEAYKLGMVSKICENEQQLF